VTDKNRAKTIQQRFGFADNDLKTPQHDGIMLWLSQHADKILAAFVSETEWGDISWLNDELAKHSRKPISQNELPQRRPPRVLSTIWEHPVMSGKYIVGFVDMLIEYATDELVFSGKDFSWYTAMSSHNTTICVEVKSSIPSLGELIRQIRMYQQYQNGIYVVVSPDARYADALRSQGIEFYHYNPDPADVAML